MEHQEFLDTLEQIIEAQVAVKLLEAKLDIVEAWEPYSYKLQDAQVEWLEVRGCRKRKLVAHEGFEGYGVEFICPPGTANAFEAFFASPDER